MSLRRTVGAAVPGVPEQVESLLDSFSGKGRRQALANEEGLRKPVGGIVFPNRGLLEYRDGTVNGVGRGSPTGEARSAESAPQAAERRLAAERALDAVLADSFPASDPPPWTLGVSLRRED